MSPNHTLFFFIYQLPSVCSCALYLYHVAALWWAIDLNVFYYLCPAAGPNVITAMFDVRQYMYGHKYISVEKS